MLRTRTFTPTCSFLHLSTMFLRRGKGQILEDPNPNSSKVRHPHSLHFFISVLYFKERDTEIRSVGGRIAQSNHIFQFQAHSSCELKSHAEPHHITLIHEPQSARQDNEDTENQKDHHHYCMSHLILKVGTQILEGWRKLYWYLFHALKFDYLCFQKHSGQKPYLRTNKKHFIKWSVRQMIYATQKVGLNSWGEEILTVV